MYVCPFFLQFPSHLGHHRALSRVSCAIQSMLISYLFYTQQCIYIYASPNLPIHSNHPCSLSICMFVFYTHGFISALQISSSIQFPRFHIYALIYNICFSPTILIHGFMLPNFASTSNYPFVLSYKQKCHWSFSQVGTKPKTRVRELLTDQKGQQRLSNSSDNLFLCLLINELNYYI